jgi:hypothetical protein
MMRAFHRGEAVSRTSRARFRGERVATLRDEDIEAEARALIRETIERSGWYQSLPRAEREKRIEQDVEQHWRLRVPDAMKRLEQSRGG